MYSYFCFYQKEIKKKKEREKKIKKSFLSKEPNVCIHVAWASLHVAMQQ